MVLFYLSFQRFPPVSVSPNEVITICPTIVNDLRDEIYQPDTDRIPLRICIAWVEREGSSWKKLSVEEKCLWEGPLSAYKQCQIKVPSCDIRKDSQDFHLALWTVSPLLDEKPRKKRKMTEKDDLPWIFDLGSIPMLKEDKVVIVPVLSAPIKVLGKGKEKIDNHRSSSTVRSIQIAGSKCTEVCEESGYQLDKVRENRDK